MVHYVSLGKYEEILCEGHTYISAIDSSCSVRTDWRISCASVLVTLFFSSWGRWSLKQGYLSRVEEQGIHKTSNISKHQDCLIRICWIGPGRTQHIDQSHTNNVYLAYPTPIWNSPWSAHGNTCITGKTLHLEVNNEEPGQAAQKRLALHWWQKLSIIMASALSAAQENYIPQL